MPTKGLPTLLYEFMASAGVVLQLARPTVSERSTTILDSGGEMPVEAEALENMLGDTSLFYNPSNRHGALAVVDSRKQMERRIRVRRSAVKLLLVHGRSSGKSTSSVAPEVKNKLLFTNTVLDDSEEPVANTDSPILERALRIYCRIFQCQMKALTDDLEQCGCGIEMKVDFGLTVSPYNVR